jgi:hypothetical protein
LADEFKIQFEHISFEVTHKLALVSRVSSSCRRSVEGILDASLCWNHVHRQNC